MSDRERPSGSHSSGLLGDLESIRSLLEENAADPAPAGDDEVPLLEDVVHGGVSINETFVSGEGDFDTSDDTSGLNEDIFKALLSDEWRESARELLDEARAAIEQHQTEWTPEHTDELNAALKVRIDETMQHWLRDLVASRIDDLRRELLTAMSEQIRATIDEQFQHDSPHEDPDGQ